MSDATNAAPATSGAPATSAAPAGAAPTASGAPASLLTEGGQGEAKPGEGTQSQPGEAKPGSEVPETYEFKMPEGVELDDAAAAEFSTLAKELKLPAAEAQRVADIAIKMAQRQAEQTAKTVKDWADQSKADKEFGGDNLDANLAVAKKAIDTFGSKELKALLVESGLGNHPELIRFAFKAGKAMSDDTFVKGGNPGTTNVPIEKRLYPTMN
jgi:hypothetical protein